jgi:hypothetical protein
MRTKTARAQREPRRIDAQPADLQPVSAQPANTSSMMPNDAEVWQMISEAAYYRAEKRGFAPGFQADDWTQAEAEVKERLQALQSRR